MDIAGSPGRGGENTVPQLALRWLLALDDFRNSSDHEISTLSSKFSQMNFQRMSADLSFSRIRREPNSIFLDSVEHGIGVACERQSEHDDETDDSQQRQDENAAFGAGSSSAHERRAERVRAQQMVFDHESAVRDTIEKGLGPVPRGVKADSPPK